jgi:hypothetical protein
MWHATVRLVDYLVSYFNISMMHSHASAARSTRELLECQLCVSFRKRYDGNATLLTLQPLFVSATGDLAACRAS